MAEDFFELGSPRRHQWVVINDGSSWGNLGTDHAQPIWNQNAGRRTKRNQPFQPPLR